MYQADLKRQNADLLDTRLLEDLIGDLSDEAAGYEYAADPTLAGKPPDRPHDLKMAANLYSRATPLTEKFLRQQPANENLQETLAESQARPHFARRTAFARRKRDAGTNRAARVAKIGPTQC